MTAGSEGIEPEFTDSPPYALLEMPRAEPDLIDRIAQALPEDVRGEYYRELRHCRSLPENDEMLRLLRAMQFLVLLIDRAPTRVAEERERLDKLLAAAVDNISALSAASEAYQKGLTRKLADLPTEIANGISPAAVAGEIREILREEFMRSTIPNTADDLAMVSDQMKNVCVDFASSSDRLASTYRGAAEDARKAVDSLNSEIMEATANVTRFTGEVAQRCTQAYRWAFLMVGMGSLVMGMALGMMFERWLVTPTDTALQPATAKIAAAPSPDETAPQAPEQKAKARKGGSEKDTQPGAPPTPLTTAPAKD